MAMACNAMRPAAGRELTLPHDLAKLAYFQRVVSMQQVTVHVAKTNLSKLIEAALAIRNSPKNRSEQPRD